MDMMLWYEKAGARYMYSGVATGTDPPAAPPSLSPNLTLTLSLSPILILTLTISVPTWNKHIIRDKERDWVAIPHRQLRVTICE